MRGTATASAYWEQLYPYCFDRSGVQDANRTWTKPVRHS